MKRYKEWSRRKKGVSGIIAATFLFAMIFTTGFAYFMFVQYNYQLQHQAAIERNQMDFDQSLEQFEVGGSVSNNKLYAQVNNTGPVAITIVHVFFINGTTGAFIKDEPINPGITINPGTKATIGNGINYASGDILIKVLTARGNIGSGIYPPLTLPSLPGWPYGPGGPTAPSIVFSYGSMKTNQSNLAPVGIWGPPVITPTTARNGFYINASFFNNSPYPITIGTGSSVYMAAQLQKNPAQQAFLAGYCTQTVTILPGQLKGIVFKLTISDTKVDTSGTTFEGLAGLVGNTTRTIDNPSGFWSGSLMMDGLTVWQNGASFTNTPTKVNSNTAQSFTLTVTNRGDTYDGNKINKVVLVVNSSFSGVAAGTPPTGWIKSVTGNTITWTAISSSYYIPVGSSKSFTWNATAPIVSSDTVYLQTCYAYFDGSSEPRIVTGGFGTVVTT
jgi:hypothetical protein